MKLIDDKFTGDINIAGDVKALELMDRVIAGNRAAEELLVYIGDNLLEEILAGKAPDESVYNLEFDNTIVEISYSKYDINNALVHSVDGGYITAGHDSSTIETIQSKFNKQLLELNT